MEMLTRAQVHGRFHEYSFKYTSKLKPTFTPTKCDLVFC